MFFLKKKTSMRQRYNINIFWLNALSLAYLQTISKVVAFLWYLTFSEDKGVLSDFFYLNGCVDTVCLNWKLKAYLLRTVSFMITNSVKAGHMSHCYFFQQTPEKKKKKLKQRGARYCINTGLIKSLCSLQGRDNLKWTAIFLPLLIYPHFIEKSNLETWL